LSRFSQELSAASLMLGEIVSSRLTENDSAMATKSTRALTFAVSGRKVGGSSALQWLVAEVTVKNGDAKVIVVSASQVLADGWRHRPFEAEQLDAVAEYGGGLFLRVLECGEGEWNQLDDSSVLLASSIADSASSSNALPSLEYAYSRQDLNVRPGRFFRNHRAVVWVGVELG
jgi:hypothetical protein